MIKLTHPQIALLESIDDDGFVVRPGTMKPAIATKIAAKLIEQKLVREIRARAASPIWRKDADDRAFSLKVLKAGRDALGAGKSVDAASSQPTPGSTNVGKANVALAKGAELSRDASKVGTGADGTKRSAILTLMRRDGGATIDDLISATGWLPHTTRAALTGLRKRGIAVERQKDAGRGTSVYRVLSVPPAAA